MGGWHRAHLLALGLWGGIVLAEAVLEIAARREPAHAPAVAHVHYWIDLLCEGPVLVLVLATGAALALQTHLTTLHWVKISAALLAVGVNAWCIGVVVRRHRRSQAGDAAAVARHGRLVLRAFSIGAPPALLALYLGLRLSGG